MSDKEKDLEITQEDMTPKTESISELKEAPKKSPIKLITRIVLLITVFFFIWYVLSERHTPYTDQARIKGLITPVTPRVSGNVIQINVRLHQKVKKGDTLFELDKQPFLIAIAKAEANIDNTSQSVSASGSSVKSAKGKLGVAEAQLERARRKVKILEKINEEFSLKRKKSKTKKKEERGYGYSYIVESQDE